LICSDPDDTRVLSILKKRTDDVDVKRYAQQLLLERGSLTYTLEKCHRLKEEITKEIMSLGGNEPLLRLLKKLDIQLQTIKSSPAPRKEPTVESA
jgi:geranylgeranyl diphosphate synthase type 3